eukprot:8398-Heterococcus_DN1.PRE.4
MALLQRSNESPSCSYGSACFWLRDCLALVAAAAAPVSRQRDVQTPHYCQGSLVLPQSDCNSNAMMRNLRSSFMHIVQVCAMPSLLTVFGTAALEQLAQADVTFITCSMHVHEEACCTQAALTSTLSRLSAGSTAVLFLLCMYWSSHAVKCSTVPISRCCMGHCTSACCQESCSSALAAMKSSTAFSKRAAVSSNISSSSHRLH